MILSVHYPPTDLMHQSSKDDIFRHQNNNLIKNNRMERVDDVNKTNTNLDSASISIGTSPHGNYI